ncbi:MAG: sulfatase [Alcaligenes faecalis]
MNTKIKSDSWKFVADSKVVSKPGAKIVVKELILTEQGRRAITSGSKGITEGAKENFGPPNKKGLVPA